MTTRARIRQQLDQAISLVVSRISVAAITNLRDGTARDTGWHASRWVGAVGTPTAIDTPPTREGRQAGVSFSQQASSIAILSRYRVSQGPTVRIGNDGNYIENLDRRDNFVQGAIDRAVRIPLTGTGLR